MSHKWWQNIRKLFKRDSESLSSSSRRRLATSGDGNILFSPYGDGSAMAVATVYRCVKLLGDSVASLRLQYMRRKNGRYTEYTQSNLHYLLTVQPQPEMSAVAFWSMAVQMMLVLGNAYIYPRRIMGEITDLVLCSPHTVSHDAINGKYHITDSYNGVYGTFDEEDIIHLYLHTSDGRRGESVLSYAARTMQIAASGERETGYRFQNGGNVHGIVSNDNTVTGFGNVQDDQLDNAAESMDVRFQSGERIVSVPGNVEFKQISLSSTDMQFLETRKFTVREICRFFGVHPSFVFDDTSNNYKSAEMSNVAFLSNTLNPILRRIESELERKLISRANCCQEKFVFDRRGIYAMDLQALAAYQKKTIESGIYTINDWRRIENQPEVEGGDTVYVSANIKPLGYQDNAVSGGEQSMQ